MSIKQKKQKIIFSNLPRDKTINRTRVRDGIETNRKSKIIMRVYLIF